MRIQSVRFRNVKDMVSCLEDLQTAMENIDGHWSRAAREAKALDEERPADKTERQRARQGLRRWKSIRSQIAADLDATLRNVGELCASLDGKDGTAHAIQGLRARLEHIAIKRASSLARADETFVSTRPRGRRRAR